MVLHIRTGHEMIVAVLLGGCFSEQERYFPPPLFCSSRWKPEDDQNWKALERFLGLPKALKRRGSKVASQRAGLKL